MSTLAEGASQNVDQIRKSKDGSSKDGSSPSDQVTGGHYGPGNVGRLKVIGVALPVLYVLTIELVRFRLVDTQIFHYSASLTLAIVTVVAVVIFSLVMFHFIGRTQAEATELVADLLRRKREGHGLYDVLLRISNQDTLVDLLAALAMHARDLLASDDAVVQLNEAATRSAQLDSTLPRTVALGEGVCVSADAQGSHGVHEQRVTRAIRSSPEFKESLRVPIQSRDRTLGELWVGRKSSVAFTERDRQFLATLAGLASIAVTSARMREGEQLSAILAERERLAREMHDSLAQVLGVTHLRLRALGLREDRSGAHANATELNELADFCQEAYGEVREAILDLRESSQTGKSLVDSLRSYLDKYSKQSGIATSLETTPNDELLLAPHSEIQIIRVIQEALTNTRKHSGAASAVVRITKEEGGMATFVVEDDGRGFDPTPELLDSDGFGLHSMHQRMALIRGTLLIDSALGRGTRVVAAVPAVPTPTQIRGDVNSAVKSVN